MSALARVIAGVFAGLTCEVLSTEGDNVTVRMSLFGRPREETLPRADVEMADADPRRSLRAEIEDDIELFALRLEAAFLRERAQLPERAEHSSRPPFMHRNAAPEINGRNGASSISHRKQSYSRVAVSSALLVGKERTHGCLG